MIWLLTEPRVPTCGRARRAAAAGAGAAASPAEALAASLAACDGHELPGGAVLLCQEAPLQVCLSRQL